MANKIAQVQSADREFNQYQSNVSSAMNPILNNPLSYGSILQDLTLSVGTNVVNHKLGRSLQGWFPVRYQGSWAQIYDEQNTNATPQTTLILVSSAEVTVNLYVF